MDFLGKVVFLIQVFVNFMDRIQGEVTTNTSKPCGVNRACDENMRCEDDMFCHCYVEGRFYIWKQGQCVTEQSTGADNLFLKIPASDSYILFDLIQMKGLECGNTTTGHYRRSHVDRLPDACLKDVHLYFGSNVTLKANKDIMYDTEGCIAYQYTRTNKMTDNLTGCIKSTVVSYFSMMLTDNNGTLFGEISITTFNKISTIVYTLPVHPNCSSTPFVETEQCPSDTKQPVVEVNGHYAYLHDDVVIECRFISLSKVTTVRWSKDDMLLANGDTDGYQIAVSIDQQVSNITLFKVTTAEIGVYKCDVNSLDGKNNDKFNFELQQEIPRPKLERVTVGSNEYVAMGLDEHVTTGANEILRCSVLEIYPTLLNIWLEVSNDRSDSRHTISCRTNHTGDMSSCLIDLDVRFDDLGYYQCCANNTKGIGYSVQITVEARPWEVNISQENDALLGNELRITCVTKSFPRPDNMYLLRNGATIKLTHATNSAGTSSNQILSLNADGSLFYSFDAVQSVSLDNAADSYQCKVKNSVGETSSRVIFVDVIGIQFYQVSDKTVTFGDVFDVTCPITYVKPVNFNITWFINDTVQQFDSVSIQKNRTVSLKADFSKNGEVKCCVTNNKTQRNSSGWFITVVGDYPTVRSWMFYNGNMYDTKLSVNVSDRVEMVCDIKAVPDKLDIFWIKDRNGMTTIIRPSRSSTNLTFDPVDSMHEGNYTCNVSNAVGAVTGNTLTLLVNETEPMCPCSCDYKKKLQLWKSRNLTKEELLREMEPLMQEVLNNMKIDKSKISSVIRKLTSAPDDRKSANQIGSFGIVMLVGAFSVIIIFDILTLVKFCSGFRRRDR